LGTSPGSPQSFMRAWKLANPRRVAGAGSTWSLRNIVLQNDELDVLAADVADDIGLRIEVERGFGVIIRVADGKIKKNVSPTILVNYGFTRANREIGVPGAGRPI
jgi:hypothetical protein